MRIRIDTHSRVKSALPPRHLSQQRSAGAKTLLVICPTPQHGSTRKSLRGLHGQYHCPSTAQRQVQRAKGARHKHRAQQLSEGRRHASVTHIHERTASIICSFREHSYEKADHKRPVEDNPSWQGCSRMQAGPSAGNPEKGAFYHTGLIGSTN